MPARINPQAVVKASPLNIADLLNLHCFAIPDHQRDYVWKDGNIRQLWNDIVTHYRKSSLDEELKTSPDAYFLGSMVVLKPDQDNLFEVIDGQQRLTTLTCLAAVLLEYLRELSAPQARGPIQQFESMLAHYRGGEYQPQVRLSSTENGRFLFDSCVTSRTQADRVSYWNTDPAAQALLARSNSPASRIKVALSLLHQEVGSFLDKATPDKRAAKLMSLGMVVAECLVVLLIEAQSTSTAYDLFESLNYRGMPLTQADLIKNEVLKAAGDTPSREEVVENWADIKDSLTTHDLLTLPDFLHYSFLSRRPAIKANQLFDSARQVVASSGSVDYTKSLLEDAAALECLLKGDIAKWKPATNQALGDLRRVLNIKLSYVALLAAFHKYADDRDQFDTHVQMVVNFVFRYMKILDGDVSQLAGIMQDTARMIREGESASNIGTELAKHATDELFVENFKRFSVSSSKLGYYVVYKLEVAKLSGTLPVPHGEEQHLEHIMPQRPGVAEWPEAHARKASNAAHFKEFLWRVGNLLPLTKEINTYIRNKGITFKLQNPAGKCYESPDLHLQSPTEVRSYLDSAGNWTAESIENRQSDLAKNFATKAWPLI
jgi:hypothetical protein